MLYSEITAVCSQTQTKHINILWGGMTTFLVLGQEAVRHCSAQPLTEEGALPHDAFEVAQMQQYIATSTAVPNERSNCLHKAESALRRHCLDS